MAIYAYTTTIDTHKTVGEITAMLVKRGALQVSTTYENMNPVSISFMVPTKGISIFFRMDCNYLGALAAMKADSKVPKAKCNEQQAYRTAWRIIFIYIQAQMSLIECNLYQMPQLLLPFIVNQQTGLTMWQQIESGNTAAFLGDGK